VREVGVRELKVHTSKILRNLRERRTRYLVTYRGRPVAILAPLEPAVMASAEPDSNESAWQELVRLGNEISKGWSAPMSSAELLSALRR
jgi:antitoxin (DNA-binding transcriptional repressor) of toxin-antitoxin stability system